MKRLLLCLVLLAAGSVYAQDVGGSIGAATGATVHVCVSITPDDDPYDDGDVIAGGSVTDPLALTGAFRVAHSGIVQNIEVTNTEVDGLGFDVCLFTADPTTATTTDQSAMVVPSAELSKWLGCFSVSTKTALSATELYRTNNLALAVKSATTTLYAVLRAVGAPEWAAAQKVYVCADILQD